METNQMLAFWLAIWMVAIVFLVLRQWRLKSVMAGLVLAHVANMWLLHWFAASLYLLPWHYGLIPPDILLLGLRQAAIGTLAFTGGSLIITPLISKWSGFPKPATVIARPDQRIPNTYLVFGLLCYFVLIPLLSSIPSMGAVLSSGWNLFLLGLIIKCWQAWHQRKWNKFLSWIGIAMLMPLLTVITQGFLGYGIVMLLTLFSVIATFYRPRWQVVLAGIIAVFLLMSVYVTYMRDRDAIRKTVWGGESFSRRFDVVSETFFNPEVFNIYDERHLTLVELRLNQCALIGPAVLYISDGHKELAWGSTLIDAVLAIIPRAIWLDKPITAGSGNLVADYTGIYFAQGTSVGIGQVMEFYINFGTAGVIGGFLVLGIVVTLLDRAAGQRLREGNWKAATFWFLPGLALLQVGGSLVEITAGGVSALLLAFFLNRFVIPRIKDKDARQPVAGTRRQPADILTVRQ